jgi:hypothetical protein
MNNQAEIIEDDDEELDTEMESETEVDDEEEADEAGADVDSEDEEGDEDDVVIEIAGESPPPEDDAKAPEWVRDLRKSHREQQRENKQLKDQLAKLSSTVQPKTVELGKKPTIEAADYDSDLYEQQLTDWFDRKKRLRRSRKGRKQNGVVNKTPGTPPWLPTANTARRSRSRTLKTRDSCAG